jgi:TM2 domain-containing membrane protein YozV
MVVVAFCGGEYCFVFVVILGKQRFCLGRSINWKKKKLCAVKLFWTWDCLFITRPSVRKICGVAMFSFAEFKSTLHALSLVRRAVGQGG